MTPNILTETSSHLYKQYKTQTPCVYLQEHKKSHEKNYQAFVCDACGRAYATPVGLTRHKRRDHQQVINGKGLEYHVCTQCNQQFNSKSVLLRHIKYKHSSEYAWLPLKVLVTTVDALGHI